MASKELREMQDMDPKKKRKRGKHDNEEGEDEKDGGAKAVIKDALQKKKGFKKFRK
jgi:hypothetical protein